MNNKKKLKVSIILVTIILFASVGIRLTITRIQRSKSPYPELADGKEVVTLWLKDSYYSPSIREAVKKYNDNNTDNIFIDYQTYSSDYFNLLRLAMMTKDKPDIFQFGFYDFLKDDELYTINDIGIDYSKADDNNVFYYKGKPMGVKVAGNTVKFIWNKEIFAQAGLDPNRGPKNWDEVIAFSRQIKEKLPNVVPFEFPAAGYYDLKVSIGEPSINQGSIYTSFWDYKNGKYNFSYSKDILRIYSNMYKENLIPKNFTSKDRKSIRDDIYYKRAAMAISTYEDKTYFLTNRFLDFELGVKELPKLYGADEANYYYAEDVNCLVANKNDDNLRAIRKVYQWLLDVCLNNDETNILKYKSNNYEVYEEYDAHENFIYEKKDPTATLGFSQTVINNLFYQGIRGVRNVDQIVNNLDNFMKNYTYEVTKKEKDYFKYYIDKE